MNHHLMDVYEQTKKITALLENQDKERRTQYHTVGFRLKGKKRIMYGHGYWPTLKSDNKGNYVGMFRESAYQIIDGTFYKCIIDKKNNIYLPYDTGDADAINKYHTSTRQERRVAEKRVKKNEKAFAMARINK